MTINLLIQALITFGIQVIGDFALMLLHKFAKVLEADLIKVYHTDNLSGALSFVPLRKLARIFSSRKAISPLMTQYPRNGSCRIEKNALVRVYDYTVLLEMCKRYSELLQV